MTPTVNSPCQDVQCYCNLRPKSDNTQTIRPLAKTKLAKIQQLWLLKKKIDKYDLKNLTNFRHNRNWMIVICVVYISYIDLLYSFQ